MRTHTFTRCQIRIYLPSIPAAGTRSLSGQRLSKQLRNQNYRIQSKEVQCEDG